MSQDERPPVKLEPTKLDFTLEVVAGLIIVALWGILILSWLFPESFPKNHFQNRMFSDALLLTIIAVFFYRCTRKLPTKDGEVIKITEENVMRQCRRTATISRLSLIYLFLFFGGPTCIQLFFPKDDTRSLEDKFVWILIGLMLCISIVLYVRDWLLKKKI